jgi:hypothetical protein
VNAGLTTPKLTGSHAARRGGGDDGHARREAGAAKVDHVGGDRMKRGGTTPDSPENRACGRGCASDLPTPETRPIFEIVQLTNPTEIP